MSVQAIAWAYEQKLDMSPKFLLVTLANFTNHANECWPSKARLAREMGCSESTVCKHLVTLEQLGLIRTFKRSKDGVQLSTLIRLSIGSTNDVQEMEGEEHEWGLVTTDGGVRQTEGVVRDTIHPRSATRMGVVRDADGGGPRRGDKPLIEPLLNRKCSMQNTPKDSKRGSRLPADWSLPDEWRSWSQINFSPDDAAITLEADRFKDYWIARPGQAGCKLDWQATWRNWCRNARGVPATKVQRPACETWQSKRDQNARIIYQLATGGHAHG